jgi:ribosomal protein S18 acetylase RimI-like enzyme
MASEPQQQPGTLQTDSVLVRTMRPEDLAAVVAIDTQATGRRRPRYFELMLERAVKHASLQVSLTAELEGQVAGFLIASLYYGEFGLVEPSASIDAIGVAPRFRGQHVGGALMRQLRLNLGALRITTLRTEVAWDDFELLAFFKREGFAPTGRLCLECPLDPTKPDE